MILGYFVNSVSLLLGMSRSADANTDAPNDPYLPEFGSELMRYEIFVDRVDTFRTTDRKITQEEV